MKANQQRLYRDVAFLTSIFPPRNHKNPASLKKAADYIREKFGETGLPIETQQWEVKGNIYENVIAGYAPDREKRLIIGAHYDVYKETPGADDNASSVAGLLELGRLLTTHKPELDYGIDLIAFSLEEPPFFKKKEMGSNIHAQSVRNNAENLLGMISMEMIGYYDSQPGILQNRKELIVSGIRKYDDFNIKVSELLRGSPHLDSRRIVFDDDFKNNGPSDHRNYWPLGVPAVMIIGTGGSKNLNYHKETDTIDTLDFTTMTIAVEQIYKMISGF